MTLLFILIPVAVAALVFWGCYIFRNVIEGRPRNLNYDGTYTSKSIRNMPMYEYALDNLTYHSYIDKFVDTGEEYYLEEALKSLEPIENETVSF